MATPDFWAVLLAFALVVWVIVKEW